MLDRIRCYFCGKVLKKDDIVPSSDVNYVKFFDKIRDEEYVIGIKCKNCLKK
jgi:hypothetical protein